MGRRDERSPPPGRPGHLKNISYGGRRPSACVAAVAGQICNWCRPSSWRSGLSRHMFDWGFPARCPGSATAGRPSVLHPHILTLVPAVVAAVSTVQAAALAWRVPSPTTRPPLRAGAVCRSTTGPSCVRGTAAAICHHLPAMADVIGPTFDSGPLLYDGGADDAAVATTVRRGAPSEASVPPD